MGNTRLQMTYTKALTVVFLLLAVLGLSSCALFQSPEKYVTHVRGRVTIEGTNDFSGINVRVSYYEYGQGTMVLATTMTNAAGYFDMDRIQFVPDQVGYTVYAYKSGYAGADEYFSIYYGYDGTPFVFNDMLLHRQKMMVFDWAWKAGDGSSFVGATTGHDALYSYVKDSNHSSRFDFDCAAGGNCNGADIRFYDNDDTTTSFYAREHRVWDMGAVPLSSVSSVPIGGGKTWSDIPLVVGRTYVLETDGGYAKFRVVSLGVAP